MVNAMSIYDKGGNVSNTAYNIDGLALATVYDKDGNAIPISGSDYDHYDNEYQHTILQARNAWASEYRNDPAILPLLLTTDQHGSLNNSNGDGRLLYPYLALAINWSECSASLNLGDIGEPTGDNFSYLVSANQTLSNIPSSKRIDVIGNHDTWSSWCNDSTQNEPNAITWDYLNTYFDNSNYNGFIRKGTHQSSEYMIDESRKIKYVVIGCWDYDKTIGGYSHYVINSNNLDAIIQSLSMVDDYDIILLSHIQPFNNQTQSDGTTTWYIPPVDGSSASSTTSSVGAIVNPSETSLDALINGRKNKSSGIVYDSYGNPHSFDFTSCTSDLICSLHGHSHMDLYNWQGGTSRNMPCIIFDAYHYDNMPFFFINIDRTKQRLNIWKVDKTPAIYNYQIHFTDPSV